ncbi:MAG: hypothetical protein A2Y00_02375 [Omnitrophica WOR_2 bacterium GWF2_43_52]|nr:MAG: hypothetical protein A2062_01715 [Omnitrophica WOR_2 bacterium GWA2_44_7]OGX20287.1 MAG: hypothetical protein A2Y00_02375 [Omnitrophica WOR_2 bacterium GWF2_43_52]OGX56388.1 MAG: hypothetical protein A2460_01835 [Omnitrophica WOR_2 bacterium RIFOXYC2_FULL_43_9]HAH21284.1 hypothetical protein [Candidatus Omnitrophota bacterium]HBG63904.1 hypothetical protein [Candidatus Omnitrophota bacterium]
MNEKNRIFIADDDAVTLKSLKDLLSLSGFEVETAQEPIEILSKVKAFKPQLILLDLLMPQLDGFEICQILNQDRDTQGVPIIVVSALGGYVDIKKAYKFGVVDYVTKPYDFKSILGQIHKAIAYKEVFREEVNFISTVLDSAGVLIMILNEKGRILRFNRACEQISGYSFAEVAGKYLWDLFMGNEEVKSLFEQSDAGMFPRKYESQWLDKSGGERSISWTDTAITNTFGVVEYIIMAGVDITERKRSEERLKKAYQELKQAHLQLMQSSKMVAVGRLSSWIAHEVKNPLAIIIQGAEYLKSTVSAESEVFDSSERIVRAALRADKIVKDLLDFSRHPQSLESKETDIAALIEESLALVEHQLGLRNIKVARDFTLSLPKIKVNSDQMKQVFINILVNAVEAMHAGGTITISLTQVTLESASSVIEIAFTDTGCGISEENIVKVFDPFFSTKKKEGSAGLGLAITKEIVEKHKGSISIKSKPGQETSVIIQLPAG